MCPEAFAPEECPGLRSLLSVACASSNLQPNQSFRNQAVACLKCYQSNKSLFCVCSSPLTKTFSCISFNYHLPSLLLFLSCFPSPSPSTLYSSAHLFFAALLPNSAAYHASHWLCSPGPAMTVSFTRVSPVSSLSLCQSPAPTAWTLAQPQH